VDAIPAGLRADGGLIFPANEYGRPFASAAALGNKFADGCKAAGLKPVICDGRTCSYCAHSLRKIALRTLALAGATGVDLMAVSGHASLDQVQEYLKKVNQERAADAAMAKLSTPATGAPRPTHHRG
jgi:integrase